ncbi:hypothetical protein LZ188_16240, partial [Rhodovulum sulfidophilum]|nr:hypothetical protein [Rhodovulum sulfidophilum]
ADFMAAAAIDPDLGAADRVADGLDMSLGPPRARPSQSEREDQTQFLPHMQLMQFRYASGK